MSSADRFPGARDPRPGDSTSRAGAAARPQEPPEFFRERRAPAADGLRIVGLVGPAGSGKSTVARALERLGAVVIDADRIGHEVTDHDPDVREALAAEYGPGIYGADGTLDRRRVAARVFADPEARERLNRLVHPRILQRMRARLAELLSAGFRGVVLVDAALLLDWHFERACDAVLAVVAPEDAQLARLAASRGWTAEEARARLAAQRSAAFFAAVADVVIDNRDTPAALERAAAAALAKLAAERP